MAPHRAPAANHLGRTFRVSTPCYRRVKGRKTLLALGDKPDPLKHLDRIDQTIWEQYQVHLKRTTPLERAQFYARQMEARGLKSTASLERALGEPFHRVWRALRLLELPEPVQRYLEEHRTPEMVRYFTERKLLVLLKLRDPRPIWRRFMGAHREDSFATQRKRFYELRAASRELKARFGLQKWDNLKEKHVKLLVERWKAEDRGRRTVDQKLTHLRWLLQKIGKPNLLPRTNTDLGIGPGPRHTRAGKVVPEDKLRELLADVQDPRIRAMTLLARHLGLRFKEAALFRPWRDWQGDRVWVKRGTKGGRPRYLFLHSAQQAVALDQARAVTSKDEGLIPPEMATYEQWRQQVYRELRGAGLGRASDNTFHDLRRGYVVDRMRHLLKDRRLDRARAASLVAREVGHNRAEVLEWYLTDDDAWHSMEAA